MQFAKNLLIFVITTFVLTACVSGCKKEPIKKDCPLMYKLDPIAFDTGIDSESCMLLASLQNMAQITPPVTIAAIRSQLETGQFQLFSDAGFDQFLNRLYSLPLDTTALTTAEISILNTIFVYLDPPEGLSCCSGLDYPTLISDVDMTFTPRVGSATFEYVLDLSLNSLFSCDIFDVNVNITQLGGGIPQTNPLVMQKLGCVNGKQAFKFLWLDFSATPIGGNYSFICDFRDSTGTVLSSVTVGWTP